MAVMASVVPVAVLAALAAAACPKTMVVDSLIALEIDARVRASQTGDGIAGVEIHFRDVSLGNRSSGTERRVGTTDPAGTYRGTFGYFWGEEIRGDPARQAVRPRKFGLIFRRAGYDERLVEFDLDKLPTTDVSTYAVHVGTHLSAISP
jgi:hypothetical protein